MGFGCPMAADQRLVCYSRPPPYAVETIPILRCYDPVMAALSLATDLGMGQPLEFALTACVLAMRLGQRWACLSASCAMCPTLACCASSAATALRNRGHLPHRLRKPAHDRAPRYHPGQAAVVLEHQQALVAALEHEPDGFVLRRRRANRWRIAIGQCAGSPGAVALGRHGRRRCRRAQRNLQVIADQAARLNKQVQLQLDISRLQTGQLLIGLSVGLYVVKELVTLHDGTVEVASEEGRGSTFTICLPLAHNAPGATPGTVTPEQ